MARLIKENWLPVNAADDPFAPRAYLYPDVVSVGDDLSFADGSSLVPILTDSCLIWIDYVPSDKFAHDSRIVLISGPEDDPDATSEAGLWWPGTFWNFGWFRIVELFIF